MATLKCPQCKLVADRPTEEQAEAWVERHIRRDHASAPTKRTRSAKEPTTRNPRTKK